MELDRNLTLVRSVGENRPLASIGEPGEVEFVSETDIDAFPDGSPEQCVLPVLSTPAMLLTPTCNLSEDYWLFSPLFAVAAQTKMNRKTLHSTSGGYTDAFGIYAHPNGLFEESFTTFHDITSVPSEPFRIFLTSRIANLSKESQNLLEDKFARFLSRGWGYAPHEKVEQDGFYRCRNCRRFYGLPNVTVYLTAGSHPPKCESCTAIKERESWELLVKHKRSKPLPKVPSPPTMFTRVLRMMRITK
jgi:hypothetical protein